MTVVVQELTDANEYEEVGRVEDGEITAGEDALTAIDREEVWTGMTPDELTARFDGPYIMAAIRPTDGEREQTTQEAIGTKQTPEGVPDGYVYVSPDEEVGDEYDVVESPQGGTYRSPEPVDDEDGDGGSDLPGDPPDDMSAFEARNYIFDHTGPLDSDTFNDNEDAAVAIVEAGNADPEVAAEALLEMSDASGDGFNMLGQNMAGRVANAITGPTEYGVNIPYKTSGFDYARGEAVDDFNDEYPEQVTRVVDEAVNEWQLGMFAKETAPLFQLAAEQKDNDTLPEGGRFGDDEYIDDVLEMPVTYEEKEAIRAKQEQTQEMLREAFGDEITVFRGQSTSDTNPTRADPSDAPARMKEAAKDGDTVEHEHRPAESWTTDPGYAAFYSNPGKDDMSVDPSETDGVLMRTTVPVEDVVMAAHTTEMEPRESEVVLAHEETAEYDADQLIPDDEVTNQKLVEEALRVVSDDSDDSDDGVEQAAGETVRVDAEDIDPEWLHRDPEGEDEYDPVTQEAIGTKQTPEGVPENYIYYPPDEEPPEDHDVVQSPNGATYASPEPVDDADADSAPDAPDAGDDADGDAGGDEVPDASDRADSDPNKATSEAANDAAAEMEREVADILGPEPGRDDFEEAEQFVADAVAVDEVDFSSFDAAQAETASAELARMNETGELSDIDSFRSSIPETERATDGQMPAHYDRDGKGMSVDPNALGTRANQRLSEAGVTSTPSETHMMEHIAALTEHIESLEAGNGEADEDTSLEEAAEETGVDLGEVAAKVGQLSVATTATLVAETYVMARNGYPQPSQVRRLYRFLGGPELSDFRGGDD